MVLHKSVAAPALMIGFMLVASALIPLAETYHWFTVLGGGSSSLLVAGVANINSSVYLISSYSGSLFIVNMSSDLGDVIGAYRLSGLPTSDSDYVPGDPHLYLGAGNGVMDVDVGALASSGSASLYTPRYVSGRAAAVEGVAATDVFVVAAMNPGDGNLTLAILFRPALDDLVKETLYNVTFANVTAPLHVTDIDAVDLGAGPDTIIIAVAVTYESASSPGTKVGLVGVVELDIANGFPSSAVMKTIDTKALVGNYPVGVSISSDGQYVYLVATSDSPKGSILMKYSIADEAVVSASLVTGTGPGSVPYLVSVGDVGGGYLIAVGTASNKSSTTDNDVVVMEIGTDLAPIRAWLIGGEDSEIINHTAALDLTAYVFTGGTTTSFRDGDYPTAFAMLFSSGISNGSNYKWVASAPAYSSPSSGPTTLLTTNIESYSIGGPNTGTANLTNVGIGSVDVSAYEMIGDSSPYYVATNGDTPLPIPEPWAVALAVLGVALVSYTVLRKRY